MAGVNVINRAMYPNGPLRLHMGSYIPNGLGAGTGLAFCWQKVPFDCKVAAVFMSYKGGTAHLDAVTLQTLDGTKNVVAAQDMSADKASVKQTLHADVATLVIKAGDTFVGICDSSGASEAGYLAWDIDIVPVYEQELKR